MRNPDKYIRKAVAEAWGIANPDIPIFDTVVPTSEPTPDKFVLIQNVEKSRFAESKNHYEWQGSFSLMFVSINPKGFIVSSEVDDLEEKSIPLVEGISVEGFRVNFCKFVSSTPTNFESPAESVTRKVTRFEMWLNKSML